MRAKILAWLENLNEASAPSARNVVSPILTPPSCIWNRPRPMHNSISVHARAGRQNTSWEAGCSQEDQPAAGHFANCVAKLDLVSSRAGVS